MALNRINGRGWVLAILTVGCAAAPLSDAVSQESSATLIRAPAWATPAQFLGSLDANSEVSFLVHLRMRNYEAAQAELADITDPASPNFGRFLSDEEFDLKYAPTLDDVAAVGSDLASLGLRVTSVPKNRAYVAVTGPVPQIEQAFQLHLGTYSVAGSVERAPTAPGVIPSLLAKHASAVTGLHTARAHVGPLGRNPNQISGAAYCAVYKHPRFDNTDPAWGGGFAFPIPVEMCGLRPGDVRKTYGLGGMVENELDGRGVTVAITGAWQSATLIADAQRYARVYDSDHLLRSSQVVALNAPSGGDPSAPVDPGWIYEQVFDIEGVHSTAPGANIVFVGAATNGTNDLIAAINMIVQERLATIITNSWSLDYDDVGTFADSEASALDPIIVQAGLKGIGMYFSTGDWGDNQLIGAPTPSVFYPISNPNVTAVGGTSLFLDRDGSIAYETGWETGESLPATDTTGVPIWSPAAPGLLVFGGGGGPSHRYAQPAYQRGIVPRALAGVNNARVIPDVAMLGDFDSGILYGLTDPYSGQYTVYSHGGGTSLAVQIFGGTMALVEQKAGHKIGPANGRLYRAASQGNAFRDIVPTRSPQAVVHVATWLDSEDPPGLQVQLGDGSLVDHTLHSGAGFDNVTGLGVPNGEAFVRALAAP